MSDGVGVNEILQIQLRGKGASDRGITEITASHFPKYSPSLVMEL